MGKYNFELDLDSENSLSDIIKMIRPSSKVLEFGCANGRLTKYLYENMNCEVDIVEIDENSGHEAQKFCKRSLIGSIDGDIEKYKWLEYFKDARYDYIIFADVLEHLYNPKKVLKNCGKILENDGSVMISIPNIAHNSVIIDLFNNEFKYNKLGILDNTHIQFFTHKSLLRMISECGYKAVVEKASYSRVGENEIINSYREVDREVAKALRKREKANVYQFIFELKKNEYIIEEPQIKTTKYLKNSDENLEYEFVCYIKEDNDDDFQETKTIRQYINPNNVLKLDVDFREYKFIRELRIDPITTNCTIKIDSIYYMINNQKVDVKVMSTNGLEIYDGEYIFLTEDPQIILSTSDTKIDDLHLEISFIDFDSEYINKYYSFIKKLMDKKVYSVREKDGIIKEKDGIIKEKDEIIKEKDEIIKEKEQIIKEKEKKYKTIINNIENELRNIKIMYDCVLNSKIWKIRNQIKKIFGFFEK